MANDYYNGAEGTGIAPFLRARAEDVTGQLLAVKNGFDKLPSVAALAQNRLGYVVATGSANALSVAVVPPATAYVPGTTLKIKTSQRNTGPVTVNLNDLGPKPVLNARGVALIGGDIDGGAVVDAVYDGSAFRITSYYAGEPESVSLFQDAVASSRDVMAAVVNPTPGQNLYLAEPGLSGWFKWSNSDQSAVIAIDPWRALRVPLTSNPSGSTGAWSRVLDGDTLAPAEYGIPLDSHWLTGGGTDVTAILQHLLDLPRTNARARRLVMTGTALVGGLDVSGNTTIECIGTAGFYLKNFANRPIIRNKNPTRNLNGRVDKNIRFIGGRYNGNYQAQIHEAAANKINGWNVGFALYGTEYLTFENVIVVNPRTFGIHVANSRVINITDCRQELPDGFLDLYNRDFIHLNGPIDLLTIRNISGQSNDDFIALNAEDGEQDLLVTDELGPNVGRGPITRVLVDGVHMENCWRGIRILSRTELIDQVTIRNVSGTTRGHYLALDPFSAGPNPPPGAGNLGSITLENFDVDIPAFRFFESPCLMNLKARSLVLRNFKKFNSNDATATAGMFLFGANFQVDHFEVGLEVNDRGAMDMGTAPLFVFQALGLHIKRFKLKIDWHRAATVPKGGLLMLLKDNAIIDDMILEGGTFNRTNTLINMNAYGVLRRLRMLFNEASDPVLDAAFMFYDGSSTGFPSGTGTGGGTHPRVTAFGNKGLPNFTGAGTASIILEPAA